MLYLYVTISLDCMDLSNETALDISKPKQHQTLYIQNYILWILVKKGVKSQKESDSIKHKFNSKHVLKNLVISSILCESQHLNYII